MLSLSNFVLLFLDINECGSNPCANGGTCADEVNRHQCTCVDGYDGPKCEDSE